MRCLTLIVASSPYSGREAEYEEWYDDHVLHMLTIPGVTAARRFRSAGDERNGPTQGFFTMYDWVVSDVDDARSQLVEFRSSGVAPITDVVDPSSICAWYIEPIESGG